MLDWDKLRIFYAVAGAKSFTRAGETLNLSQSAISRQIAALESQMQVTLFHRHARGLLLTEQGEILYRTVTEVFSKLAATENALQDSKERPKGPLRITAPVALGTTWLTPHMREFVETYPDITVTLLVDDRELDLTMREADVAIRAWPAKQPELIQKHLCTLHNSLYASNDYLRKNGVPRSWDDLKKHRLISFGEDTRLPFVEVHWLFKKEESQALELAAAFKINSLFGMLRAVENGIGIAALPDYMAEGRGAISKVLPEVKGPTTDAYFIYPTELRNSKRINVFREFIVRKMAEHRF